MMKEMRVLFCKIQSPLICFCKPSAGNIYSSGPLKLEPYVVHATDSSDNSSSEDVVHGKKEAEILLKSCIRKKLPICEPDSTEDGVGKKKGVKWVDHLGKELAEIKEFESSETRDTDNEEESSRCLCVIL